MPLSDQFSTLSHSSICQDLSNITLSNVEYLISSDGHNYDHIVFNKNETTRRRRRSSDNLTDNHGQPPFQGRVIGGEIANIKSEFNFNTSQVKYAN